MGDMVLKNIACPECGNTVSATIDSDEEIVTLEASYRDYSVDCGNCGHTLRIGTE